jgi:hypothetical protein
MPLISYYKKIRIFSLCRPYIICLQKGILFAERPKAETVKKATGMHFFCYFFWAHKKSKLIPSLVTFLGAQENNNTPLFLLFLSKQK